MRYTATFKVCIFGDTGVGKTSLIHRFVTNRFPIDTKFTLGVDIFYADLEIEKYQVKLQLWDLGGDSKFEMFMPIYARGSSGGIFMYDITQKRSFNTLEKWISLFKKNAFQEPLNIPILGVGGKKDLDHFRQICLDKISCLDSTNTIYDFMECSAKTGENVNKIFESITYNMLTTSGLI
ncbi:MAG: GTP-binding protein [Promethearchaeota archaeon]|nr:MAG: GTP-binding protein [Candidatus Lokiarchaeota archaeon]